MYYNWGQGEPNDRNNHMAEDCVELKVTSDKSFWNDGDCGNWLPYICQEFSCTCPGQSANAAEFFSITISKLKLQ